MSCSRRVSVVTAVLALGLLGSSAFAAAVEDPVSWAVTCLDLERNGLVLVAWMDGLDDSRLERIARASDWGSLRDLASTLPPEYRSRLTFEDAWGGDFRVAFTSAGLVVVSVGQDGRTRIEETLPPLVEQNFGEHDRIVRTEFRPERGTLGDDFVYAVPHEWLYRPLTEEGARERTMSDLRSIATAIESYAIDNDVYPATADHLKPLEGLADVVEPLYIKTLPLVDGWGTPFLHRSDGANYVVVSAGRDGLFVLDLPEDLSDLDPASFDGPNADPDRDIVFVNGQFVQWGEVR